MDIERKGEDYHIKLGEGETADNALRAIGVASFELARPAGMGRLHFDGGSTMRPEQADEYVREREGSKFLYMDYVEGRQVKTKVSAQADGTMLFDGYIFERDRGNPEPVFRRAQEILDNIDSSASLPAELTRTRDQFESSSLDSMLNGRGYERKPGETDSQFRKRIFPDLYAGDNIAALEFLFAKHESDWAGAEKMGYLALVSFERDEKELENFASAVIPSESEQARRLSRSLGEGNPQPDERYLPNNPALVYEYVKFLEGRLNAELLPIGFVMAANLAIYDLAHGVNGFTGEPIQNTLVNLSDQAYGELFAITPFIAQASYSEEFAREVEEILRKTL